MGGWSRDGFEDAGFANWIDVTTSQGMPGATRSWEKSGTDSPLEPPEGAEPCWRLG